MAVRLPDGCHIEISKNEYMEIANKVLLKCRRKAWESEEEYLYRWQQETQKEMISEIMYQWTNSNDNL